jgi:hypothetical protein
MNARWKKGDENKNKNGGCGEVGHGMEFLSFFF